jgi:hypothetical protein
MKKNPMDTIQRKHGAKARAQAEQLVAEPQGFCLVAAKRTPTTVTFANREGAYRWFTDRGRSRVIKH